MIEDDIARLDLKVENLWHDMDKMTKEQLEMYTERLYIKLYGLKYEQYAKSAEERYWSHVNAVYQPH